MAQVAAAAARLSGVEKVLLADDALYAHRLAEPLAALIVALAPAYDAIVAAATSTGKNVMPRVAALLDVMQISEVTKIHAPDIFERPIYAGNAIEMVQSSDAKKVITVRTAAFQPAGEGGSARDRKPAGRGGSGGLAFRIGGARAFGSAGARLGAGRRLGRTGLAGRREFCGADRAARR